MRIDNPKDVYLLSKEIINKKDETLIIFYLNNNGHVLEKKVFQEQTLQLKIKVEQIFIPAILNKSKFVILCHNHPSGILSASQKDITSTKVIISAAKTLGITVIDHLIITKDGFYSIIKKAKVCLLSGHQRHQ